MKKTLIALAVATIAGISVTSAQASPKIQEERITIKKFGKTWRVTKSTAIARCNASSNPKHKNWEIYCEYVPEVLAEKNQCQFLFWKTDCATTSESKFVKEDIINDKKKTFSESSVLSKAESMIGLDARRDRKILKEKLSEANGQTVDPAYIPWCAAWANMVLSEAGMETTGSLMARSFLAWGKATKMPQIGDVVVMRRGRNRNNGHVGFFYSFVDINGAKMVAVLGGNQNKEVRISYYPISKVIAYRTAA